MSESDLTVHIQLNSSTHVKCFLGMCNVMEPIKKEAETWTAKIPWAQLYILSKFAYDNRHGGITTQNPVVSRTT